MALNVSLLYSDLDTFVCDCESLPLEKEDTMFAVQFMIAMSGPYSHVKERRQEIHDLLGNYLIGKLLHVDGDMGFSVRYGDGVALVCQIRRGGF